MSSSFVRGARAAACVALAAGLVAFPRRARANGRYPQAGSIVASADGARLAARSTFGMLLSADGGATWRWICEASLGYTGLYDPAYAITSDATLVGLPNGVALSSDAGAAAIEGCTFAHASGAFEGFYVVDLASSPATAGGNDVVGVSSPLDTSTPGFHATFARSTDGGRSWIAGAPLPEDFVPTTVDVAPSRPDRVYAAGKAAYPLFGEIARSDDGGATWSSSIFDLHGATAPYVAAVDPTNADRVYVRLFGDVDRLWVSTNAGTTFSEIYVGAGKLLGFAVSPDGAHVAVGGPDDGVLVADTTSPTFVKVSALGVRCLRWTTAGLFACADDATDGFEIGLSRDVGKTWEARLRWRDLAPLSCPAGTTTGDDCPSLWPTVAGSIGADAGSDASVTTDGARGDAPDDTNDATVDDGDDDAMAADGASTRDGSSSGCGCRIAIGKDAKADALPSIAALVAAAAFVRRVCVRTLRSRLPGSSSSTPRARDSAQR